MNGPKAEKRKKRKSKICTSCGKRKKLSSYYKNTASLDGYGVYCKECAYHKRKEWIDNNKEHSLKLAKEYRDTHKLEIAEYHSRYYSIKKNAKRQAAYQKEYKKRKAKELAAYYEKYNKENRKHLSEKALQYYYNNRERILKLRRAQSKKKKTKK